MVYLTHYIGARGVTHVLKTLKAPQPKMLVSWSTVGDNYAARYYPSKKAWRLFDLRKFRVRKRMRGWALTDLPPPSLEAPSVEACIMFAVLKG